MEVKLLEEVVDFIKGTRPLYLEKKRLYNNHYYIGYRMLITIGSGLYKVEGISKKEANRLLREKVKQLARGLSSRFIGYDRLTDNQKVVIISLSYDIGIKGVITSELYEVILNGELIKAQGLLRKFSYYKKQPIYQLTKHREREIEIFLSLGGEEESNKKVIEYE